MMNIEHLTELVKKGESETLEFKKSTGQLQRTMETLCAFLNANGGMILIGVTPKGELVGQDVGEDTIHDIAEAFRGLEPPLSTEYQRIRIGDSGREVIVLTVTPFVETRLFSYRGRPYERVGKETRAMPLETYQRLLLERMHSTKRWENALAQGYTLDDIDMEQVARVIQEARRKNRIPSVTSSEPLDFLARIGLVTEGGKILNGAMVLFGKKFMPDYPQCVVRLARFRGTTKNEFIDNRQERGHLFHLLEMAATFIQTHNPVSGVVVPGRLQRQDTPLYPPNAIREALVNAFCHRDYTVIGGSVDVAIFDDRLEVWNEGTLPFGQTVEDLRTYHRSRPRNPLIAEALYKAGYIEMWGRGIQNMILDCVTDDVPEPEFFQQAGSMAVRFTQPVMAGPGKKPGLLSLRHRKVLRILIDESPLAFQNIMERIKEPISERTLRNDLALLRKRDFIISEGFGRGAVWSLIRQNKAEE